MKSRLVGVGLAALTVSACAQAATISMRGGTRDFAPEDYEDVYDAWTRSEHDFSWRRLTDVLRVSATFESWEFRWAYVVRYAYDYSLDTRARHEMLRTSLDDARHNHRFFVTLIGENFREGNIASRHSAWRVLLVDDTGGQTPPREIERIRHPSAADRVYFPSVNPHRDTFRISFPAVRDDGTPSIPPGSSEIVLLFAGARGRVELRWELDPVTSPAE